MKIKYVVKELHVELDAALRVINDKVIDDILVKMPSVTEYRVLSKGKYFIHIVYKHGFQSIDCRLEAVKKLTSNGFMIEGVGDKCKFLLTTIIGSKEGTPVASIKIIYDGQGEGAARTLLDKIADYLARQIVSEARKFAEEKRAIEASKAFWSEYTLSKIMDKNSLPIYSERLRNSLFEKARLSDIVLVKYSNNYPCSRVLDAIRRGELAGSTYYIVCMDKDLSLKTRFLVSDNVIKGIATLVEGLWFTGEYAIKITIDNLDKLNRVRIWVLREVSL